MTDLIDWVHDARERTCELVADLSDSQLMGPPLPTVNPLLWEIGHVAWFQEKWVRRRGGRSSLRADADALYDSAAIPHDVRWDLLLPSREETLRYLTEVKDRVVEKLQGRELTQEDIYFTVLSVFHEDMHTEAFTYTRQTLGYPPPQFQGGARDGGSVRARERQSARAPERGSALGALALARSCAGPLPGEVLIPGGLFHLGAAPDEPFVFDNEKWAHPVQVRPFAIARAPVTQAEFAAFVNDSGYQQPRFWSEDGWNWRTQAGAEHPVYWQGQTSGSWLRRDFDRWVPLEAHRPVLHVNWHEAMAYCSWAGRRLPTEAEWEVAAAAEPARGQGTGDRGQGLAPRKRPFPWGDSLTDNPPANLDWQAMGCVDVADFAGGDSAFGCRQMIGNVWEWTACKFLPYPGFQADPYKEYSEPWFATHKVLRGGCWASRSRLLRNTWRNFCLPERRDVWAGFRTCALEP
jgi:iron(II)-dependent oxidoreductase